MSMRKILLVDDSKSARYALRLLLQKHGCEVEAVESAEKALEQVSTDLPDAIFMDHLMPGMNGFEALEALKANPQTAHIPVVMCTSNDELPYQQQAQEKGALGILPKPATPEKLTAILEAIDTTIAAQVPPEPEPTVPAPTPPAPAPAAAPPSLGTIVGLVREELRRLMDSEVRPLVNHSLDRMRTDLLETFNRSSEQSSQQMNADMARLREELGTAADSQPMAAELSDKIDGAIGQLRNELAQREAEQTQAVLQKISGDLLPNALQQGIGQLEQRAIQRVEVRFNELNKGLAEELSQHPQLMRRLSEQVGTMAEQKATEVAAARAREIAEGAVEARAGEITTPLVQVTQNVAKRMYLMAGLAALAGILSSLLVFVLLR